MRRSRLLTPVRVFAALLALGVLAAACGSHPAGTSTRSSPTREASSPTDRMSSPSPSQAMIEAPTPTQPEPPSSEAAAFLALCRMREAVAAGDLGRAAGIFHDEIHETLHALADALQDLDLTAAAELLQAKARVEEELDRDVIRAEELAGAVAGLSRALASALEALGTPVPGCPPETGS